METVSFDSHGTRCEAWWVPATSDDLARPAGRPCVVLGHGFAATRDAGLLPFAERFAALGCDVLVFDYRGFGTSDGSPRQDVNHRRHRQDYHAALAYVRSRPGADPSRIALWGSSYSGGHVVAVAAKDGRVAAVISQGAAMDGLAALFGVQKSAGPSKALAMTGAGLRDAVRGLARRDPLTLPVVGPVGSNAVISAPGSETGYQANHGTDLPQRDARARRAADRPQPSRARGEEGALPDARRHRRAGQHRAGVRGARRSPIARRGPRPSRSTAATSTSTSARSSRRTSRARSNS